MKTKQRFTITVKNSRWEDVPAFEGATGGRSVPLPEEFWIVVTEWDASPTGKHVSAENPVQGPLVHEGLFLTEEQAHARVDRLGSMYGWAKAVRVNP